MIENKKDTDVNSRRVRRGSRRKIVTCFRASATCSGEFGDEEVQEMTVISSLLEQTMLLIRQAFHSTL